MSRVSGSRRRAELVQVIERGTLQFQRNPSAYRLRVAGLAAVGTLLRAVVVLVAVGAFIALLALAAFSDDPWQFLVERKLGLLLLPLAWLLWRGVRTRTRPPEGFLMQPSEFAQITADLALVRRKTGARSIHRLYLTDEFELRVEQSPRLGVFGWNRNALYIGLPLILSLTLDEARALLTHELAHFSKSGDRFGARIYRTRGSWNRTIDAMEEAGGRTFALLRGLWQRYGSYFGAYSFALARANEFKADAIAARLTSPRATAMALVATHVQSGILDERYWQPLLERANADPEPAGDAYSGLYRFVRNYAAARSEVLTRVRRAMRRADDDEDTHPPLRDRLDAIGAPPELPGVLEVSAAEYWLAPQLERVLAEFDARWRTRHLRQWKERHEQAHTATMRLAELEAVSEPIRSAAQWWELASLSDRYRPDRDPLVLYQAFLERYPDSFDARLAVGRLLAKKGDARAIPLLQSVLDSFHHVIPACEAAYAFYKDAGDESSARLWDERAGVQLEQYERAYRQRARLSRGDEFFQAKVADDTLIELKRVLGGNARVRHAWICQKFVSLLPEQPVYVVVVETREWFSESDAFLNAIRDELRTPGALFVLGRRGKQDELVTKVMRACTPII